MLWNWFYQISWNCALNPMSGLRKRDCASETSCCYFLRVILGLSKLYFITAHDIEFVEMGLYFVCEICLVSPAAPGICCRKLFICLPLFLSLPLSLFTTDLFLLLLCLISLVFFFNYDPLDIKVILNCQVKYHISKYDACWGRFILPC